MNMLPKMMTDAEVEESLKDVPGFEEGKRERESIMLLGETLRDLRKVRLGISQKEAAKLIGIEQPDLSRLETGLGKRGALYVTVTRILDAYQAYLRQTDPRIHVGLYICVSYDDSRTIELSPLNAMNLEEESTRAQPAESPSSSAPK